MRMSDFTLATSCQLVDDRSEPRESEAARRRIASQHTPEEPMDNSAFDTLTRALNSSHAQSTTRRGMTRFLGGLALGGPLALLGLNQAEAKCKKTCGPCKRCKHGKCKPKPTGTACPGGTCQGGTCIPAASPPSPPPPPPPLTCPSGTFALVGRCAPSCGDACRAKGGFCTQTFDGFPYCAPNVATCTAIPKACSSHTDCTTQEVCSQTLCGPNSTLVSRCVPFLS